jgi:hypothetical protein
VLVGPATIGAMGLLAGVLATRDKLLKRTAVARIDLLTRWKGHPPRVSVDSYVRRSRVVLRVAAIALVALAIVWIAARR